MIAILSYCNTIQKKQNLRDLIKNIKKKFPDDKILVYSHYEGVEPEYYHGSDFYIFDKNNIKSGKRFADWIHILPQKKKFYRWGEDWGFAVIEMIKRSSLFLNSIGYEECLFLNYDIDGSSIDDLRIFDIARNMDNDEIGIFSTWGNSPNSFNLTSFYLKLSKIDIDFFKGITLDRYKAYGNELIPEQIFYSMITESFGNRFKIHQFNTRSVQSNASRVLPDNSSLKKYFGTILPSRATGPTPNQFGLAAWTTTSEIDRMVVEINKKEYTLQNLIEGEDKKISFYANLPNDIEINKIWIKQIGDEVLKKSYIIDGMDEEYWKNNYHEEI